MSRPADPPASASDALTPPDPRWVERFRGDVEALTGETPSSERMLALAVSGGPDSVAMLMLAAQAHPGAVRAATVDHGLRRESGNEAALVAELCDRIAVPHQILKPRRKLSGASIQAVARTARYALLGDWAVQTGAMAVATAHHADDQAETFLLRARRGTGPSGLSGIRPRWNWDRHRWHRGYPKDGVVAVADVDRVAVIRPLLNWRRSDLRRFAEAIAAPFIDDPSNVDPRFERVRMRRLLAENPWLDAVALSKSASICADADRDLTAMFEWLSRDRLRASDVDSRHYDMSGLPRELRRRLARDAIAYVRMISAIGEGQWSEGANIEALLDALESGRKATHAGVMATPKGDLWLFAPAPPRRSH
ncbi:tRNA lysidine(34) synthetase TilS [Sphingomonas sp.]|uniref:tRNA lysidine(34) synthetase TilS n=1 Tax=Sphingomonas sp. TaxID=28214 RepID=UPI001EB8DA23|nr:tRNA lysidine(34) synthetase TilS [Sphingomonas sp.]MBX3594972.1 tRNA lysidine(34) synthetase TilS [Sphingomonas sp.]